VFDPLRWAGIGVTALISALTPVVTLADLDIGTALGGVIITEQVFSIPALGWTIVQAMTQQDLPIIMGVAILAATDLRGGGEPDRGHPVRGARPPGPGSVNPA